MADPTQNTVTWTAAAERDYKVVVISGSGNDTEVGTMAEGNTGTVGPFNVPIGHAVRVMNDH